MRISEAISPSAPLAVPFAGGAVLNIEYRPAQITLAQMEDMISEAEEAEAAEKAEKSAENTTKSELEVARQRVKQVRERLVKQVLSTLVSWDLTEDDGETVIALTEEAVAVVPLNVFAEIVKEVRKHQSAGDSGKG